MNCELRKRSGHRPWARPTKQTLRPQFTIYYSPFTIHNCVHRCFPGTWHLTPGTRHLVLNSSLVPPRRVTRYCSLESAKEAWFRVVKRTQLLEGRLEFSFTLALHGQVPQVDQKTHRLVVILWLCGLDELAYLLPGLRLPASQRLEVLGAGGDPFPLKPGLFRRLTLSLALLPLGGS